ncbi:sorting nexin-16 isoform X2 [Rhinichthys klamathensis goyatoka]|uniref:sorting nexin-16 isoform X2 n=1 Tax=Rhinichthys klamathensis goyatoka TaxID=3034132 RepID=UPI0024B52674|nr:sorting nexin-16 isoform X2 [Rhinichthys klamathensis goyatoka]
MAAPFVPVPVPIDRAPRRAAVSVPDRSQSPVTRARLSGCERSVQFSSSPHLNSSSPNPESAPESPGHWQDRPITPTVLGYEVMEERAKFTVYKVLVRKTLDESWVVFRRYTDFSRLNDKLKEMFPGFRLALPPKRWFKDNYETDFLEDRQLGLQAFLQNLVAHKDIAHCVAVREFLCLDEPPGPFDSLEESRAFCETLEESNYRLQRELLEKQREINCLKKTLEEKERHIQTLEGGINGAVLTPESPCVSGSDGSVDVESSAAEADQELLEEKQCALQSSQSSVCWCGPAVISSSPPVIQVTPLEH